MSSASSLIRTLPRLLACGLLGCFATAPSLAQSPPMENGKITDSRLKKEASIAKLQATKAVQTFMEKGSKDCATPDCKTKAPLMGADGSLNYGYMQSRSNNIMGMQMESVDTSGESSSVAVMTGQLPVLCNENGRKDNAFNKPVVLSGLAIKPLSCSVDASKTATFSFQVCTAPAFGKPVKNPDNAVDCSSNPNDANYLPPSGFVCKVKACDSEPEGSQFGWSAVQSVTSEEAKVAEQSNGRAMIFYPSLSSGVPADYTSDSETLVVVKIIDTYYNHTAPKEVEAIGVKLALRYKNQIKKEKFEKNSVVLNPEEKTEQWRSIEKLNADPRMNTDTADLGGKGAACVKDVVDGLNNDGTVKVCDETYNVKGVKPMAVSAQVVSEASQCSTTTQCISEVVKTSTWAEKCNSPANIASKECHTTRTWSMHLQSEVVQRPLAQCTETRETSAPSCTVSAATPPCWRTKYNPPLPTGSIQCIPDAPVAPATTSSTCTNTWVAFDPPPPLDYQECAAPVVTNNCSTFDAAK